MEEVYGQILLIKNYQDLENYNLSFFPEEVAIIYYDTSMNNHNKYHHLVYHTRYVIIVSEFSWNYPNMIAVSIGFNNNFIQWFSNQVIEYYEKKYNLSFEINDQEKIIANQWIISKKYSPNEFYKNLLFLGPLTENIQYLEDLKSQLTYQENYKYQTPFMNFYNIMMGQYNKQPMDSAKTLASIIIFNDN